MFAMTKERRPLVLRYKFLAPPAIFYLAYALASDTGLPRNLDGLISIFLGGGGQAAKVLASLLAATYLLLFTVTSLVYKPTVAPCAGKKDV